MTIAPGRIVTQDRDRYRVDGYLMHPEAIPADTAVPFELEMQCFSLPNWQNFWESYCCECDDYESSALTCAPGTGDYDNADGQDNDTNDSICNHSPLFEFPVAGTDPYENADVQPRGDGMAGDCCLN